MQGLKTMNNKIMLVATQCAAGMFATFCNEAHRGVNFRWKTCPDLIARFTENGMFMYFPDGKMPKYNKEELKTYIVNLVRGWIYEAGFKDEYKEDDL